MQITTTRGQIRQAVAGFSKIIRGKQSLPVLGCVRFSAHDNGIVAQATELRPIASQALDLDYWISKKVAYWTMWRPDIEMPRRATVRGMEKELERQ